MPPWACLAVVHFIARAHISTFILRCAQQPTDVSTDEDACAEVVQPLDRTTVIEDCTRLAREAEESTPIARVVGEALAVLTVTTLKSGISSHQPQDNSGSGDDFSAEKIAGVSAEVLSAANEAEKLVDGLLRVLQVMSIIFQQSIELKAQRIHLPCLTPEVTKIDVDIYILHSQDRASFMLR